MLREVKNPHTWPYLVGLSFDVTGATSGTQLIGAGDTDSFSVVSSHNINATLKSYFTRSGNVYVGSQLKDDRDSYLYGKQNTLSSVTEVRGVAVEDNTGNGLTSAHDYIVLGWRGEFSDPISPMAKVRTSRKGARLMGFRIDGTTSPASIEVGSTQASITDNGTGDYTITFNRAYGQTPIVAVSAFDANSHNVTVVSKSASAINFKTSQPGGTPADIKFHVLVLGWDSIDEQWGMRKPLETTQRKPRLLGFRIQNTAGTPTIVSGLGDTDGSIIDNGTGDYTVTFTKAFARDSIVCAMGHDGRATLLPSQSTTVGFRVNINNQAGVGVDVGCDIIVLGFDDAVEY